MGYQRPAVAHRPHLGFAPTGKTSMQRVPNRTGGARKEDR
ncbi:hypothetical protein AAW51_1047 [Caldimonas brevitalea]|uniref:Uncharacterized protein n=1 Tax=Caldimonas brevitalea TaxID=413882 RepID=A0A0G3BIB9_9BURK|nr:hypothetical protein AAW51_1047 [Caldimonas brevitalea]